MQDLRYIKALQTPYLRKHSDSSIPLSSYTNNSAKVHEALAVCSGSQSLNFNSDLISYIDS